MTIYASNDNAHPPSVSQSKKRGFTLTEIAIVLGIIGLILGAIWVAAAAVYSNLRVSKATTELLQISQAVRALYSTSPTTGETTAAVDETATWIKAGVFPTDMVSGTTVIDAWNGNVYAGSDTITVTGDAFGIMMNGVPQSACIALLTSTTGTGRDSGLYVAKAATTATTAYATLTGTATTFPVTAATAAGLCTSTTSTNVLEWAFKLKG